MRHERLPAGVEKLVQKPLEISQAPGDPYLDLNGDVWLYVTREVVLQWVSSRASLSKLGLSALLLPMSMPRVSCLRLFDFPPLMGNISHISITFGIVNLITTEAAVAHKAHSHIPPTHQLCAVFLALQTELNTCSRFYRAINSVKDIKICSPQSHWSLSVVCTWVRKQLRPGDPWSTWTGSP